jgi:hypothetical protein
MIQVNEVNACRTRSGQKKKKIEMSTLYRLCNKEQLFTSGTASQYDKMFEIACNGVTQDELACMLYICSNYRLDVIWKLITPLFNNAKEIK